MPTLADEQLHEEHMLDLGYDKYQEEITKSQRLGSHTLKGGNATVMKRELNRLVPAIEGEQRTLADTVFGHGSGRRPTEWAHLFMGLDPHKTAFITIRYGLLSFKPEEPHPYSTHAAALGKLLNTQSMWDDAQEQERLAARAEGRRNRFIGLMHAVVNVTPGTARRYLLKFDDLDHSIWSQQMRVEIGGRLLYMLTAVCKTAFTTVRIKVPNAPVHRDYPMICEDVAHEIADTDDALSWLSPQYLPTLIPPRPWAIRKGVAIGGFHYLRHPMVVTQQDDYPLNLIPPQMTEAMNAIQRVPCRINEELLDEMHWAIENNYDAVLPAETEKELPEMLPDDEWVALDPDARRALRERRADIRTGNITSKSQRVIMHQAMAAAHTMRNYREMYFPYYADFRGRVYPMGGPINPQGDKALRALIEFANPKRLGPSGLKWLMYATASAWGMDKASRSEQEQWAISHIETIRAVAGNPFGLSVEFWENCDEPWLFLAAAKDLDRALDTEQPEGYRSRLPVFIDGTCNGIQHMSAMLRDRRGGEATNLVPSDKRHDIYMIVCERVLQDLAMAVEAGVATEEERCLHERVTRAWCKRAVMCTPYGVTAYGISGFLLKERHLRGFGMPEYKLAKTLAGLLRQEIDNVVIASQYVKNWLSACAEIISQHRPTIWWSTPSGYMVRQEYRKPRLKQIDTLFGTGARRIRLWTPDENYRGSPLPKKQALGITPNLVHSFDADHMRSTVLAFGGDILTQHDCFGTHASKMDALKATVLETFVAQYRTNHLERLAAEFAKQTSQPLPRPPELGQLNIEAIRECDYAFS